MLAHLFKNMQVGGQTLCVAGLSSGLLCTLLSVKICFGTICLPDVESCFPSLPMQLVLASMAVSSAPACVDPAPLFDSVFSDMHGDQPILPRVECVRVSCHGCVLFDQMGLVS